MLDKLPDPHRPLDRFDFPSFLALSKPEPKKKMVLLGFMIFWGMIIWWIYFYLKYRPISVTNKKVLITGGGSGIGRLMAIEFAKKGAEVFIWDLNQAGMADTEQAIAALGGKCKSFRVDVTKRDEVYQTAKEIGALDILVNNAGIVTGKSVLDCEDEKMALTMQVNTISHFWTIKAFLPGMLERNSGNITTIASLAGVCGVPGLLDYCASKFGAVGLAEALFMELRKRPGCKVTATCICPFYINTGMFDGAKTKVPWLLPILDQKYVAKRIVLAIRRGEESVVMPWFGNLAFLAKVLPVPVQLWAANLLGLTEGMDDFKGRNATASTSTGSDKKKA